MKETIVAHLRVNSPRRALAHGLLVAFLCLTGATALAGEHEKSENKDQAFIKETAAGGMLEVKMAQLAEQKGQASEVKETARKMIQDHQKANDELKRIAQAKSITLPTDLDAKHRAKLDKVSAKTGAEFDKAYAEHLVKHHKKDVAKFEKASAECQDAELKAFAQRTLPTLRDHLQHSRHLAQTVGLDVNAIAVIDHEDDEANASAEIDLNKGGQSSIDIQTDKDSEAEVDVKADIDRDDDTVKIDSEKGDDKVLGVKTGPNDGKTLGIKTVPGDNRVLGLNTDKHDGKLLGLIPLPGKNRDAGAAAEVDIDQDASARVDADVDADLDVDNDNDGVSARADLDVDADDDGVSATADLDTDKNDGKTLGVKTVPGDNRVLGLNTDKNDGKFLGVIPTPDSKDDDVEVDADVDIDRDSDIDATAKTDIDLDRDQSGIRTQAEIDMDRKDSRAIGGSDSVTSGTSAQSSSHLSSDLKLSDLPASVQSAVRAQAGSSDIKSVKKVYKVELNKTGKNSVIYVTEDGKVLQESGMIR